MPHFQINLLEGKSEEQKKELVAEVIKAAQKVVGMGDDSYSVSLEEFSAEEWKNEVYPNKIMANEDILVKKPGYTM
ncbi:tautomerase family protein [Allomuricauda sp. NBRC 101325]|uniref:tautomerase family protein n=1 Tax=Allomuricauda sp. NBRC 101325 TaxID=1113758 RepID=UPI0025527BEC|nr:tautomerase family protein [Muricauda sp. NBRC 101325]